VMASVPGRATQRPRRRVHAVAPCGGSNLAVVAKVRDMDVLAQAILWRTGEGEGRWRAGHVDARDRRLAGDRAAVAEVEASVRRSVPALLHAPLRQDQAGWPAGLLVCVAGVGQHEVNERLHALS